MTSVCTSSNAAQHRDDLGELARVGGGQHLRGVANLDHLVALPHVVGDRDDVTLREVHPGYTAMLTRLTVTMSSRASDAHGSVPKQVVNVTVLVPWHGSFRVVGIASGVR